jgi:hypothetical protein
VARVSHQPDAVDQESANDFGQDDDGVEGQRNVQAASELLIAGL